MAEHCWTLKDEKVGSNRDIQITAQDLGNTSARWSVTKRTLQCGLSAGVDVVEIDNGRLKVAIVPTRGMGVWKAWKDGFELGWKSPVRGPVHPAFVPIGEPSGLGWLDGFDELMCRCGLVSNGAPDFDERGQLIHSLHGRIANLPAHKLELAVDDVKETIALTGIVEESRFHFRKLRLHSTFTMEFGSHSLTWHDEVENFGGELTQMQMLYHTNIGAPLLEEGAELRAPLRQVVPWDQASAEAGTAVWHTFPGPQQGFHQQVYLLDLLANDAGRTEILLKNADSISAVGLRFDIRQLPCFSLWRNLVPHADGYVTGLEPGTNYPNTRTRESEQGRVVPLEPNDRWQADVTLDWHTETPGITEAERRIDELQGAHDPIVLDQPDPER